MRSIGRIQKKILSVLEELTRRNKRNWFSLQFLTVFLYHPEQIDREHEKNIGKLGEFVVNWTHTKNEHRRIWESCRALEMRGYLETKIVRQKEGKETGTWGGIQKWMEVKIRR